MCDNSIIPISDEQAKLGQEIVGAGRDLAGYLAEILGDLPKDLVGLIVGDKVKAKRFIQAEMLLNKTKNYLNEQNVIEPEPPSLNVALPILESAVNENREELQDLWARLLAASMNPNKSNLVRIRFIEALKKLDPLDARVMLCVQQNNASFKMPQGNIMSVKHTIARELNLKSDEVEVSTDNLRLTGFIALTVTGGFELTPFGREFLRTTY